jgi:hypothetical protein
MPACLVGSRTLRPSAPINVPNPASPAAANPLWPARPKAERGLLAALISVRPMQLAARCRPAFILLPARRKERRRLAACPTNQEEHGIPLYPDRDAANTRSYSDTRSSLKPRNSGSSPYPTVCTVPLSCPEVPERSCRTGRQTKRIIALFLPEITMRSARRARNRAGRMGKHPSAITSIPIVAVNAHISSRMCRVVTNAARAFYSLLRQLSPLQVTNLRRIIR